MSFQSYGDIRPLARRAVNVHRSAVDRDKRASDRKPKPQPLLLVQLPLMLDESPQAPDLIRTHPPPVVPDAQLCL